MKSKGRALSAVPMVSPNSERATVVAGLPGFTVWLIKSAEAPFAVKARDILMVGHASGLKQPALVTVTAVDTVRSLPGIATTGPAGMSPGASVIRGRGAGKSVFPTIVGAEGKSVSPIIVGAEGKSVSPIIVVPGGKSVSKRVFTAATTADALGTEFTSFKGPKGGPPGEHDVNREACPI